MLFLCVQNREWQDAVCSILWLCLNTARCLGWWALGWWSLPYLDVSHRSSRTTPVPYPCVRVISSLKWSGRNSFLHPAKEKQGCRLLKTETYLFNEDCVAECHQMSAYTTWLKASVWDLWEVSSKKNAVCLMEMMNHSSFAGGRIMAGISWKKLPVRFCSSFCSLLLSLGCAHLLCLQPFSPSRDMWEAWICAVLKL